MVGNERLGSFLKAFCFGMGKLEDPMPWEEKFRVADTEDAAFRLGWNSEEPRFLMNEDDYP